MGKDGYFSRRFAIGNISDPSTLGRARHRWLLPGDQAILAYLHTIIDEMITEGDKVVCRNRWQGTSTGNGRRIEFHGFVEWRFEGNRATVTAPAEIPER